MRQLFLIVPLLALTACATGPSIDAPGHPSTTTDPGSYRPLSTRHDPGESDRESGISAAQAEDSDTWQRIRRQLVLDRHLDNAAVREKLAFYSRKQEFLDRVAERARPYLFHIVSELDRRSMPLDLALLPIVESAFQPFALSRSRAAGIWQFIPGTGVRYGLKQNWWYDGRRDIVEATRAALDYLEKLNAEFEGDWLLALAAYNAGELNVRRAVEENRRAGRSTDFFSLRLPRETRGYVPSLLAVCELLANANRYDISWQPIANEPYFAAVDVGGQIEIDVAARLAGLSREQFRNLNPGFSQWATDPDGPHRILVPVAAAESFSSQVASLPPMERVTMRQHVVANGENLGLIARRYGTTVASLQQANHLRGTLIHAGQVLTVPGGPGAARASGPVAAATGSGGTPPATEIHVVGRGENLWSIARRYGTSVTQLSAWNDLGSAAVLHPGQKLRVRAPGTTASPPGAVAVAFAAPAGSPTSYVVRQGDSLWNISRRFGVTVAQLQEWNQLRSGSVLRPGQTLIVAQPDSDAQGA